jgi:L,D-transpeptidase YcbB
MSRPALLIGLYLLAALPLSIGNCAAAQTSLPPEDAAAVTINLAYLLNNEPGLPLPVRQKYDALNAYYQENAGPLLWVGTGRIPEFLDRLAAAEADGLDPAAYPIDNLIELADAVDQTDIKGKAIVELFFSSAFLEYASDIQVGRFLPRKVDPNFFLQARTIDPLAAFNGLGNVSDLTVFFDAWQPQMPDYAALKKTLAEYRALDATGGWPAVPLGETLKPGMSDARIPALRARLAVTEGVSAEAPAGAETLYGDELVAAVQSFQARHGLDIDGAVGNQTIFALNVPVEDRIQELVIAMERWRWMPPDLGNDHLIVNIAGFDLRLVRSGELADKMAVVVGKPYSRTPVFSDAVRTIEINPYWNLPTGIAIKEELPKLKSNPSGLASLGYEAVRGSQVLPVNAVDWRQYGPGNFPFQLRQRPGPKNALGKVKFLFPNQFNVYLHDTPAQSLFERSERAFSHGCIRLSRPLDLAAEVLSGEDGWNRDRIDQTVASGKRTVIGLTTPLPIHITYLTAWVDNGRANFRNDIYKQDEKLVAALAGRTIAW